MNDVAIVGVGLHPFGRFEGMTAIEMGAIAIRRALADAGVEWRDIQFAFGGSYEVDNPDAVVALLGLTGIPFTNVYNGCATAASAPSWPPTRSGSATTTSASPSAWTSTSRGAFSADPRLCACRVWYGEIGQFLTTQVLRHEDQQVHARPRHLAPRRSPRSRRRTTATAR